MSPNFKHKSEGNSSMDMKGEQIVQYTVARRNPFFFFFFPKELQRLSGCEWIYWTLQ